MKRQIRRIALVAAGALFAVPMFLQASTRGAPKTLEEQVRHELVMLPYYNVFDNLSFEVSGGKVTLTGQAVRPTLKTDAERVVARIPGVTAVTNQITVLPLSSFDDRIRLAELRAIYGQAMLWRYGLSALPAIHIIVSNGHVTLEGVVNRQADKDVATILVNGVPGVFSVTNNLRVSKA
jgi:hyperosmotically inducible protein